MSPCPALYDGVVTVSGDGGLHELLNGLYSRRGREGDQVMARTQLGIVPGGSGESGSCQLERQTEVGEDFTITEKALKLRHWPKDHN